VAVNNHRQDSWQKVISRRFAAATNQILAGYNPALNTMHTENDYGIKTDVEER